MNLPNFVGASYVTTAQEIDCEDCVNMQPEVQESPGAKAPLVLVGSPGTQYILKFDAGGPVRGATEIENYSYFVSNDILYQLDPSNNLNPCDTGAITDGSVGTDGQPVEFAASATEMIVISAGIVYVVNDRSVSLVAMPPWTTAIDCAYLDGYFIVLDDNGDTAGGQFFISVDATTWDPLDFSNAPASNNKLRALGIDHEELWIFGTVITQVFYNNGNADFPFVPNPSGVIQQGIEAKSTRSGLDNTLFWLGRNKDGILQAFLADGYTPKRISTTAIERQWQRYSGSTEITVAWTYQMDGHAIYHLNFLGDNKSWRFDRSVNLWHRVSYRNPDTNAEECHLGSCHIQRKRLHLIGDRTAGIMWQLSPTIYLDKYGSDEVFDGVPLVSMRRAPAIFSANKNIKCSLFELITPGGIGDGSEDTPEENPSWGLRYSKDNGHNWGPEYQLQAGPQGEFNTRLRKVGLGMGRTFVFEVTFSANLPRTIIGAEIDIKICRT